MEVLELSATLGIHAMNIGVPVLVEVLQEKGLRTAPAPLTEYQEQVKADFTATRGYWHPFWDEMLELDPELFAAYTEFSSHPWHHGTLAPRSRSSSTSRSTPRRRTCTSRDSSCTSRTRSATARHRRRSSR